MNDLSWLLYLADVLPAFRSFVIRLGFFVSLMVAAWAILKVISLMFRCDGDATDEDRQLASNLEQTASPIGRLIVFYFVVLLLVQIIPSRDTIYLIAASEMGEAALETEAAEKVGRYLDELLDTLADADGGE